LAGTDKQSIVEEIRSTYAEFMDSVKGLDEAALEKPILGTWSVREIAGHIIGWQEQMTSGFERMAKGERPTPEGVDWSDVQSWNDKFAERVKDSKAADLLKELDGRVEHMITALSALPDERFGEGKTVNRMAEAAGYGHFREHTPEIKEARAAARL